jgi:hypothetical protein
MVPLGMLSKKRNTKQVWQRVEVQVIGDDDTKAAGKR